MRGPKEGDAWDDRVTPTDPWNPDAPDAPVEEAEPAAEEKARPSAWSSFLGLVRELVMVLVIALGLSLLIKTFLVQAFFIPSPSMENTLLTGDRVLVSKLTPGPFDLKRGDIVVFKDPGGWLDEGTAAPVGDLHKVLSFVGLVPSNSDDHLIKRVIGMPGDTVACCDEQGRITVNGVAVDEPYLYPGDSPSDKTFSVTVPAGHIWVLGDHRSVSQDSRFHPDVNNGMVPEANIVGRAFVNVWPLNRFGLLRNPSSAFANVPAP